MLASMATLWDRLRDVLRRGREAVTGAAPAPGPEEWFRDPRHWKSVKSSNLEAVAFYIDIRQGGSGNVLGVRFLPKGRSAGSTYYYEGVPASVAAGLLAAPSHGSYLDRFVKKAGFKYRKVS